MDQITLTHEAMRKQGIIYLLSTIISAVLFYVLRDQFVRPYGIIVIVIVVVLEFLISVYTLLKAKGKTVLNGEGITVTSVFGVKTYTWTYLKKFEIGWNYGTTKLFGMKNEKIPYIRLVFATPRRILQLAYREDVDQYIRRYCGLPVKDTWTANR